MAQSRLLTRPRKPKMFSECIGDCWGDVTVLCSDGPSKRRWVMVVVLCALVSIICSIDRTAMSVAIMPMSQMYGYSSKDKGAVASAFNVGHMITNLAGGLAAATMPAKDVLSAGVVVWSLFTLLTPWAAATRYLPALLLVRALMGLGEGVAFPTMQAIIKGWVPADKRSRSLGAIYSGHQIGSILSLIFSPLLLSSSVDTLFYVYGSLGFLWLAVWQPFVPGSPPGTGAGAYPQHAYSLPTTSPAQQQHSASVSNSSMGGSSGSSAQGLGLGGHDEAEAHGVGLHVSHVTHVHAHTGGHASAGGSSGSAGVAQTPEKPVKLKDLPWGAFLRCKPLWAIAVAHATFGITYNIVISWLPTFYAEEYGLDVKASSLLSVLPWAAMAAGTNASGWAADLLVSRQILTTTKARKVLQLLGCGGPALCLLYLGLAPQRGFLFEAVAALTLALGLLGFQAGGFASNHQDIASRYAPILFGITNACASLGGSAGVYTVGAVLDATKSWSIVLLMVAAANVCSALTYVTFATSEPLFD